MPHMTVDEFRYAVLNSSLVGLVQQNVFEGMPYVFRDSPESNNLMTEHLRQALDLPEDCVAVVGSAKTGFSLNPENFPRGFSERSDIDVIVVSEALFDRIWMTLLEWHYPRRFLNLGQVEGNWMRLRRKDIYFGWLVPSDIRYEGLAFPNVLKPLRDLSTMWFNAFQSLSLYPEFATREVSGRLYRTWDHALRYHVEGLRMIRESLKKQEGV